MLRLLPSSPNFTNGAATLASLCIILVCGEAATAQSTLSLPRYSRYLEVREMVGAVEYLHDEHRQAAQIGFQLNHRGEGVATGEDSLTVLALDDGIGFVRVFEESELRIDRLQTDLEGGKITELSVPTGLARVQVRRFNTPSSSLILRSPVGIAGVRGTEFGVGISPTGRTALATFEGEVAATAGGVEVSVAEGSYTITMPGEAPSDPQILEGADVELGLAQVGLIEADGVPAALLVGRVHPINLIYVAGEIVETDLHGEFTTIAPLVNQQVQVDVRSPSGEEQKYELRVGESEWERRYLF